MMILLGQHVGINDWLFLWRIFLEIPQNIVTYGTFYALSKAWHNEVTLYRMLFGYEFSYILSLSSLNVDVINIIRFLYCFLCNYHKTIFDVTKKRKLWCPRMALIMCCVCVCVRVCRFWTSRGDKRHRKPTWHRPSLVFLPWNAEEYERVGPLENADLRNSTAPFLEVKTWKERAFDLVSIRVPQFC